MTLLYQLFSEYSKKPEQFVPHNLFRPLLFRTIWIGFCYILLLFRFHTLIPLIHFICDILAALRVPVLYKLIELIDGLLPVDNLKVGL